MINFNKDYLSGKEVKDIFNITDPTLYQWRKKNKLEFIKISDRKFLYKTSSILKLLNKEDEIKKETTKKYVIYTRVSNTKQKGDLLKQQQIITDFINSKGIIPDLILSEIASGMNENRAEFNKLVDMVINNEVDTVFITYKDRLTRFGFEYFENLFKKFNTKIVVLNNTINQESFEKELTGDLVSIIHHFSMKMYSNRRKQLKEIQKQLE